MWIEIETLGLKMPYITVRENKAKWWITVQGLNYNEVNLFVNIFNKYTLTARWDYYQRSSAISLSPTATRRRWLSSVSRHGWLVINSLVLCTFISPYGLCLFLLCPWVNILPNAPVGGRGWQNKLFWAKFSKIRILRREARRKIALFPCFWTKST